MAKIIGNPTVTPMAVPDWNQTDATKADFIKNKPMILTEEEIIELIGEHGGGDGVGIDRIEPVYFTNEGYTKVTIYLTDGTSSDFTISDGKTPQKGVDYWTDADKAEIKSYVDEEIGNYETAISEIIELQKQFINEITFSLNGTKYTCPKGMTWAELETYDGGTIWQAEGLNIQGSVVYAGSAQLITWNMNIPISLATYTSDIISDVADNFNYSV